MSFNDGNWHNNHNDYNQITTHVNLCLELSTFDDLCCRLVQVPLPLRFYICQALCKHFYSLQSSPHLPTTPIANSFSNISPFGIFFSTFIESSAVISDHVNTILKQSDSNKFKEQFYLIALNLRAEVHEALFQKALWSNDQTNWINSLNISADLYGADIQLTEADLEASPFQNNLFGAFDKLSFISQFRKIPLQYRSSVYKALLCTVQQDKQSAEFRDWVFTIRAVDLYLDFDGIPRISEEARIYANVLFQIPSSSKITNWICLNVPRALSGQIYQEICFNALVQFDYSPLSSDELSYSRYNPGPLQNLNPFLNATSYDAFLTEFLTLNRSHRIDIHNDLYFYTQSDLVRYQEQFDWVSQCVHPYYFLDDFDDNLESESNQAVKCSHDYLVNHLVPGHQDAIFSQFAKFTEHSRFKFFLTLESKSSYEWMSSHVDLLRYIDPLYPELISATEEVKVCVGRCILASSLGEFKVEFHSIPFSMRHEVYTSLCLHQDFYHTKQRDFLNALQPLEVSIDVNHYISDDQLAIYATACSSMMNVNHLKFFFQYTIPYSIRAQIYKLILKKTKFSFTRLVTSLGSS